MTQVILLYLYCPHRSLSRVHIRAVVHTGTVARLHLCENSRQFLKRLARKAPPQFRVLRHGGQRVSLQHTFYVKSGASAEYRHDASLPYLRIYFMEVALVFVYVIFVSRVNDVYKMVFYLCPVHHIIVKILACTDGHPAIHLARVGTDYLRSGLISQSCRKRGLSACRRSQYGNQF